MLLLQQKNIKPEIELRLVVVMPKKLLLAIFMLVAIFLLGACSCIPQARAKGPIYIRTDGTVDPSTAPIQREENVYFLTENVTADEYGIVVEKDDIIIDGNGYVLYGTGSSTSKGVSVSSRNNITIRNFVIELWGDGVLISNSSSIVVSDNRISNNKFCGIRLADSCSNCTVYGNDISANNASGIAMQPSNSHCNISANNLTKHDIGIAVIWSSYCSVQENNIKDNSVGLSLEWSWNNSVSNNEITANSQIGIHFTYSSSNIVFGNNITNSLEGVKIDHSSNNALYHNRFINNAIQANTTVGSINGWDNGYPSGGNYWNDFVDTDQNRGPNQDQLGSDGIWDNPYLIDNNNIDNYPIVPEFSSTLIISTFMIATLVAVVIQRRKH